MKKLFLNSILFLFLTCSVCFANPDSGVQYDVKTTGDNLNGCGWDTGQGTTDYSQQASPQLSLTDIASNGTTTLTSATGGFTSAMVGNIINLSSGTNLTTGFYEIDTYTDTNTVIIDRDPDDAVGALTGDTVGKVGGCCADPDFVLNQLGHNGQNITWVKSGTYSQDLNFTTGSPRVWGYTTTHGDETNGTDRPLIDCTGETNCININGNLDYTEWRNLRIYNASDDCIIGNGLSNNNAMFNVLIDTCGDFGIDNTGGWDIIYAVEITNCTGGGSDIYPDKVSFSYIHDNSGIGVMGKGFYSNIVEGNSGNGISWYHGSGLYNNLSYGNTGANSDGFSLNSNTVGNKDHGFNNTSVSNGDDGYSVTSGGGYMFLDYNHAYGNGGEGFAGLCAGTAANPIGNNNLGDVDPLLNADWTIQTSSPLIAAGVTPATFTSLTGTFKINIGVDQDDNAAAGGGVGSLSVSTNF